MLKRVVLDSVLWTKDIRPPITEPARSEASEALTGTPASRARRPKTWIVRDAMGSPGRRCAKTC